MRSKKTQILLTGGTGFIGRNILEQLGQKYDIIAPTRRELDLADGEAVYNFLSQKRVELIIHAANVGGNRRLIDLQKVAHLNLSTFFNLVRAKKFFKRMIVLGSGAEYDKRYPIKKVKESEFNKTVPVDEYGFGKYVMAKYAEQNDYILHLRLFGIYGKYEDYRTRFISNVICKALLGLPVTINQNVFFDYLYVNNFVKILDCLIEKNDLRYRVYNIGSGQRVSLLFVAKLILKLLNKNLPIKLLKPGINHEYTCDVMRLRGERLKTNGGDLMIAVKELIKYYRSIQDTLRKEDLK